MKKVILALSVILIALASCKSKKKEKVSTKVAVETKKQVLVTDNVDTANSVLNWKGSSLKGSHNGEVLLKSGGIVMKNDSLQSGEFVIDMSTINCLDLESGKGKEKLEKHLKSNDFFEVEKYPFSKFVITDVKPKDDNKLAVTGNLTIKDITKSIEITASVSTIDGVVIFKSETFKIDRSDFGVKYKSKKFFSNLKDKFINDLIEFSFQVKTNKQESDS